MIIEVKNEASMKLLGEKLGSLLHGGEMINLIGDIGAGKTTFTKGIARGMGIDEDVQSPSFTISRVYSSPSNLRLAHYDFYRLSDAGIMRDELHETIHDPEAITIIEWADIVADILPKDHLTVSFVTTSNEGRSLTIEAGGKKSMKLLEVLG
jgi:tRNA threonylcarbamoyladenosine biosynthesis protein TsaE